MMIKTEPMRKSTTARAIALYGTLGGLFLNYNRKKEQYHKMCVIYK